LEIPLLAEVEAVPILTLETKTHLREEALEVWDMQLMVF
jgi:hypothetical protein